MNTRRIGSMVLWLALTLRMAGQDADVRFEQIHTGAGLSHSLVTSIVQDDLGYIWIGTQDGLNRYDGYDFEIYRPQPDGAREGLYHQWISGLYKDRHGRIWMRYWNEGLSYYDPYSERFVHFFHRADDPRSISSDYLYDRKQAGPTHFYEDAADRLWVATMGGLNRFCPETQDFERIYLRLPGGGDSLPGIHQIVGDDEGRLLVGTSQGLLRYDPAQGTTERLLSLRYDLGDYFTALAVDRDGTIWAGAAQSGLYRIRPEADGHALCADQYLAELQPNVQGEVTVSQIVQDRTGVLWLGTTSGLYRLDAAKLHFRHVLAGHYVSLIHEDGLGRIWFAAQEGNNLWLTDDGTAVRRFYHKPSDPRSLGPNKVKYLFEDNKGVLWIGHEKGGLSKFDLYDKAFQHLSRCHSLTSQMPNNDVYALHIDTSLWIGTYDGLFRRDAATGRQYVYEPAPRQYGVYSTVSDRPAGRLAGVIKPAPDGTLWVGFFDYRVSHYDPRTGRFRNFQYHPGKEDAFKIWSLRDICITRGGDVYFGGTEHGLARLIPGTTDRFTYFSHDPDDPYSISDNWIYCLFEDSEGILWIGTRKGGLCRFDPAQGVFETYRHEPGNDRSISSNTVRSIVEQQTPAGRRLWIGTEMGLNCFDPATGTFRTFFICDGLLSHVVHGILEDSHGRLWLSTNAGLSCFDPQTETFANYTKADGLQDNEFNECSYARDSEGRLYFGGVHGVTVFHPDSLRSNPFRPDLIITELRINNHRVLPGAHINGRVVLDQAIGYTAALTLKPADKVISFSMAAFHHAAPTKIRYRYKLEPFEQEWTEVNARKRYINYTNLPPGEYRLHMVCSDLDGRWDGDRDVLHIRVLPPFWDTAWFRGLLVALIFLTILAIIHIRTRRLAINKQILYRLVRERTAALEAQSAQLERTNLELKARQAEVVAQHTQIAIQRDALEQHNAELEQQKAEIQWMAERMHETDQSRLNFFTNISHEFRTPLTLILGQAESLLDQPRYDETAQVKSNIQLMYRSAMRLYRLINQLLEIRTVESGVAPLQREQLEVVAFCRGLLDLFGPMAARRAISLSLHCTQPALWGSWDADKLEKILSNLLSNAFKHTPDGGDIILVVAQQSAATSLCLEVINSGPPIAEADLPHIFDRYFYTNSQAVNGTLSSGIGLALVRDLVELHEGTISVHRQSAGTCFRVILPVGRAREVVQPLRQQDFGFARAMIEREQEVVAVGTLAEPIQADDLPIVLIVDDDPDMQQFLSRDLRQHYHVLTAGDGRSGVELAFRHIPDLIVCDVMMPGLDGMALTQMLKNDARTSHVPVLLLTARTHPEDVLAGMESGADDYLTKPFSLPVLRLKLQNMLATRQHLVASIRDHVLTLPDHVRVKAIDEGLLGRIVQIIETHLDDTSFSGDRLAREVGMSKGNLYRKLKGLTGMTVNLFIRHVRLQIAARLLRQGQFGIADVAYAVGFDNPKYFSVCFREAFGQCPRDYMYAHADTVQPVETWPPGCRHAGSDGQGSCTSKTVQPSGRVSSE